MNDAQWIELDGAANVRDLAGLATSEGVPVAASRLIRSDNLQSLTDADVRRLVDECQVRAVVDLRTGIEVRSEGPGPMTREVSVEIVHLSLFPEAEDATDAAAGEDGPVVLPWQDRDIPESDDERLRGASWVYLNYLHDRGDSVLTAVRTIAHSPGATIVHCAAGKDRTGVVIALALAEVGVEPAAIVADYARSAERIEAIFARLGASRTYADDMRTKTAQADLDAHTPKAVTMQRFLAALDEVHGGASAWLRANGWTEDDAAALRAKLLDDQAAAAKGEIRFTSDAAHFDDPRIDVAAFDMLSELAAGALLEPVCGASVWVVAMVACRPHVTIELLTTRSDEAIAAMEWPDIEQALTADRPEEQVLAAARAPSVAAEQAGVRDELAVLVRERLAKTFA